MCVCVCVLVYVRTYMCVCCVCTSVVNQSVVDVAVAGFGHIRSGGDKALLYVCSPYSVYQ